MYICVLDGFDPKSVTWTRPSVASLRGATGDKRSSYAVLPSGGPAWAVYVPARTARIDARSFMVMISGRKKIVDSQ